MKRLQPLFTLLICFEPLVAPFCEGKDEDGEVKWWKWSVRWKRSELALLAKSSSMMLNDSRLGGEKGKFVFWWFIGLGFRGLRAKGRDLWEGWARG